MTFQVNTTSWLELSREIRDRIAKLFQLPKTGHSIVHGGNILSDGYTNKDLQELSISKLNQYLSTEYDEIDILKAFKNLVERLEKNNGTDTKPEPAAGSAYPNPRARRDADGTAGADAESGGAVKENPGHAGK